MILAAVGLVLITSSALAELFMHNRSVVDLRWGNEGDGFEIRYVDPRSGLPVAPGTLLFHGAWTAGGYIYGTAYVFSSSCGPAGYRVTGYATGNDFYLEGAAPIRDANCRVVRYEWNGNAYLYFSAMR